MGDFIYFTEEQKERANAVQIADILRREHEEVERSGNEWRWKRHRSVTFRGSSWYRHSRQVGSHAIDFMQSLEGQTTGPAGMRESSSEVSSGVQNAGQYAAISSRATKKSVAALPSGSARVM